MSLKQITGGDGCTETCNVFTVDCMNDAFKVTFHANCLSGFYRYLSWENFYIGPSPTSECKFVDSDEISMTISYTACSTSLATYANFIQQTNQIHYASVEGLNFFSSFDVVCAVSKTVDTKALGGFIVTFSWNVKLVQQSEPGETSWSISTSPMRSRSSAISRTSSG